MMKTTKVSFLWRKDGQSQEAPVKVAAFGFLSHQRSVFVYGCDDTTSSRQPSRHDSDDEQMTQQAPPLLRFCDIDNGAVLLSLPAPKGMDPRLSNLKVNAWGDDVLFVSGDCSLWKVTAPNCRNHSIGCEFVPKAVSSHDEVEAEMTIRSSALPSVVELMCRPDAAPLHHRHQKTIIRQQLDAHEDPSKAAASFGIKVMETPSTNESDRAQPLSCNEDHQNPSLTPTSSLDDKTNVDDEKSGMMSLCSSDETVHDPKSPQDAAMGPLSCPAEAGRFIKSEGYRGARDGFQFRNGPWGRGYYSTQTLLEGVVETVPSHEEMPTTPPKVAIGSASKAETDGAEASQEMMVVRKDDINQRLIRSMVSAAPTLRCSVLSADGRTLYTGSWGKNKDTAARAWDVEDAGKLVHCFEGHSGNVLSLALSPDQGRLYTGSYDYAIREWDTFTGECLRELRSHRAGIHALACSPDGSQLYSCAGDNTTRVWDLETGCCLRSLYGRHEDTTWPISMCLSPDGALLATGSNGNMGASTIKVFRVRGSSHRDEGSCLATLAHFKPDAKGSRSITALAFSSCGSVLLSGGSDGSIVAWKIETRVTDTEENKGIKKGFL